MDTDPANSHITFHQTGHKTRSNRSGRIDDELRRRNTDDENPDLAFTMLARRSAEDFLSTFGANATRINSNGGGDNELRALAITTPNCPNGLPIVVKEDRLAQSETYLRDTCIPYFRDGLSASLCCAKSPAQ